MYEDNITHVFIGPRHLSFVSITVCAHYHLCPCLSGSLPGTLYLIPSWSGFFQGLLEQRGVVVPIKARRDVGFRGSVGSMNPTSLLALIRFLAQWCSSTGYEPNGQGNGGWPIFLGKSETEYRSWRGNFLQHVV